MTHLQNGVLEIDGAEDEVIYDKFSAEPSLSVEETFQVKSTLATPVVTQTSATSSQYVSETENKKPKQNDSGENSIDDEDSNGLDSQQEENLANARGSINTIRGRVKSNARQSASSAYKERLKKRLEKEKNKFTLKTLSAKSKSSNRRSFNPSKEKDISYDDDDSQTQRPTASRFKSRVSRTRSRSSGRSLESDEVFEML